MTDAFIYDTARTPRGKGKKDCSLHEVKPIDLLAGVLTHLQQRNGFDTAAVDDVVMGVVFAVYYQRTRRVMPLVIAHALLDVVAFVGYQYAGAALGLR